MLSTDTRALKACEIYRFMDECFVEDVFGIFGRLKEVNLCSAKTALKDFRLDLDEVKGLVRLWRETEPDYVKETVETNKVMINGVGFSFIVISLEARSWAKSDTIEEAKDALDETIGYFYDYEEKPYQVWLVTDDTTISGIGGFTYSVDSTPPMRIR